MFSSARAKVERDRGTASASREAHTSARWREEVNSWKAQLLSAAVVSARRGCSSGEGDVMSDSVGITTATRPTKSAQY